VRKQTWPAGVLLVIGVFTAFESSRLTLGSPGLPGPGFFPFYLSVGLILASTALLVESLRQKLPDDGRIGETFNRSKPVLAFLAMFVYAFVLEPLGFVISTFIVLVVLWKIAEGKSWRPAIVRSVVATALTYVMFRMLSVQIPVTPRFL
jgi:putative tricarboxylic transport membrane protein